jgi:hypothetical protein
VVPFAIWLAGSWLPRPHAYVFGLLLVASPFVGYRDGAWTTSGPLLEDHQKRIAVDADVRHILANIAHLERRAVIVAGYKLPAIEAALDAPPDASRRLVYLIKNPSKLSKLRGEGYEIYYVDREIVRYQTQMNGWRPLAQGARLLPE